MDRNALAIFLAMCAIALVFFAVGIVRNNTLALVVALCIFILAPFIFGLRARS